MLIYSDAILIDRFQVKTRPGVIFFGQHFRPVYKIWLLQLTGQVIMAYNISEILLSISI